MKAYCQILEAFLHVQALAASYTGRPWGVSEASRYYCIFTLALSQRLLCNGQQCFQQSPHCSSNCFLPSNELKSTCPCSRRDDRIGCVQATFASAEVRAKSLAEMQQTDAAEVEKLLQRQQAAEAQYDQGLSKLRATARQLQSLASRVSFSIFCRLI